MLVIFDVDGTIVDSQELIVAAQRTAFEAHGLTPPDRRASLSIVGLSLPEAFTVLAGPDGPVEALIGSYTEAFRALLASPAYQEPLFPGAGETIAWLNGRPDIVLGIATGKSRRGVARLVGRYGWEGIFATIQTADDAPSKPHPGMILRALAETGTDPSRAVMIGDSTFDMTMARAAGIGAIGVTWGYHAPQALLDAGAQAMVGSYAELRRHLDSVLEPA